ncbi:unnamed protein product [Trichobilharzia regenti]|nr:unnamed protein product [Trichobilharzia regenti]
MTESKPKLCFSFSQRKKQPILNPALKKSEAFKSKNQDGRVDYDIKIPIGSPEATEEADEADYDSVPIEKFGVALLAGLGLGADPTAVQNAKQDVLTSKTEELTWTPGARCQIIFGKNKGLYGTISKEVIDVLQHTVRLVSSKEYAVYSNCINQSEVDEYKAREAEQLSKKLDRDVDFNSSKVQSNGKHHQSHHDSRSRTFKNMDEDKPLKCEPRKPPGSTDWLRPKLIVRCLDRNYCSGKYNGEKVTVVTVNSNRCSCKTESGQIIEGLSTKYLQTFIPYEMNSVLMIVNGERSGQLARLIKRDSQNQMVDVKTRAGILLRYHFDSICAINDPFDN